MTEKSQEDRREELLTEFMMDDANADYTTIIEWINRYSEYVRDFIDLAVELVLDERRPEAMEALRDAEKSTYPVQRILLSEGRCVTSPHEGREQWT